MMMTDNPMNIPNGWIMTPTANKDYQQIVNYAMQCGAVWAGIELVSLHKMRESVNVSFSSEHDAIEFSYYVQDWLHDMGFDKLPITREQEFVMIWLPVNA